ncbi:Uncharacterised protein [Pseudomonas luteola]|uniref:Uncharacterized protein n=1 Tax=Pseudomonas luteola TaxID=47886 RepID=A0A2X2DHE6_PSELU|nr:Uncharacterised protein [Pseudomonas luteola]
MRLTFIYFVSFAIELESPVSGVLSEVKSAFVKAWTAMP